MRLLMLPPKRDCPQLLARGAEAATAPAGWVELVAEFVGDGRAVEGRQLKQPVSFVHGIRIAFDIVAGGHDLAAIAAINQADGVGHAQGRSGDGRAWQQQVGAAIFWLALDAKVNAGRLPRPERGLLEHEQVESGVTGVKVSMIGVKVAGGSIRLDVEVHGRRQLNAGQRGKGVAGTVPAR